MRPVHLIAAERRERRLVHVVDGRGLVIDDVAEQEVTAVQRIGRRRIDRLVVGQQRPRERR
jgi:hypothetical protein